MSTRVSLSVRSVRATGHAGGPLSATEALASRRAAGRTGKLASSRTGSSGAAAADAPSAAAFLSPRGVGSVDLGSDRRSSGGVAARASSLSLSREPTGAEQAPVSPQLSPTAILPLSEAVPPPPQSAQLQRVGTAHLEAAVQLLQSRAGSMQKDAAALASALTGLSTKVDDSTEGLEVLMDVLDTMVSRNDLEVVEQRLRAQLDTAEAKSLKDAAELDALRDSVARQGLVAVQRLDKLEKQLERIDVAEERTTALEAAAAQDEEKFSNKLEDELQGFARSFAKAASGVDGVVQAVDRKLTHLEMTLVRDAVTQTDTCPRAPPQISPVSPSF